MSSSNILICYALALLVLQAYCKCPDSLEMVIGSRTTPEAGDPTPGEGITFLTIDNSKLIRKSLAESSIVGENPSYIAYSKPFFYFGDDRNPGVLRQLRMSRRAPFFRTRSIRAAAGVGVHVTVVSKMRSVKRTGRARAQQRSKVRLVVSADYGGSSVSSYIRTNDSFEAADVFNVPLELAAQNRDSSLSFQQSAPHPHMVLKYKNGVIVPDLGSDLVFYLGISKNGKIRERSRLEFSPGDGPRHAAIHPKSETVYVVNELSLSVAVLCPVGKDQFAIAGREELLIKSSGEEEEITAAAIRVSDDGKFLYVSIRYLTAERGTIVAFSLDPRSGDIKKRLGEWSAQGSHPRDFIIIENVKFNGKCSSFLAIANRDTDNVALVERNVTTGELSNEAAASTTVRTPVSVLIYD